MVGHFTRGNLSAEPGATDGGISRPATANAVRRVRKRPGLTLTGVSVQA